MSLRWVEQTGNQRWCPLWRKDAVFGICLSSCLLKVPEDLLDYLRTLNARNDFYMPSTVLANFNINIEESLKALHPCHGSVPLFRALIEPVGTGCFRFDRLFPALGAPSLV